MATPSPPAPLPNWPTYCIVSSTTPHQAIDALGMPSRPSTIYTIYAKYSGLPAFFYEIPWNLLLNILWENPLKICSGNILQESLETLKNHKESQGISSLNKVTDLEIFETAKCDAISYRGPVWPRLIGQSKPSSCNQPVRSHSCTQLPLEYISNISNVSNVSNVY